MSTAKDIKNLIAQYEKERKASIKDDFDRAIECADMVGRLEFQLE